MSPLRRLFVASFLALTLGAMAVAASPHTQWGGWYWPFIDYPMYSGAHHRGEAIPFRRVEAAPCGTGDPIELDLQSLGVRWFHLNDLLTRISQGDDQVAAEAADGLRELVHEHHPERFCRLLVQVRTVRVGEVPEGGIEAVPWTLVAELDTR